MFKRYSGEKHIGRLSRGMSLQPRSFDRKQHRHFMSLQIDSSAVPDASSYSIRTASYFRRIESLQSFTRYSYSVERTRASLSLLCLREGGCKWLSSLQEQLDVIRPFAPFHTFIVVGMYGCAHVDASGSELWCGLFCWIRPALDCICSRAARSISIDRVVRWGSDGGRIEKGIQGLHDGFQMHQ